MGRGYNTQFLLYPQPIFMWWNKFLLFYMCHSVKGLTRCYKNGSFLHFYLLFFNLNHSWDTTASAFRKQMDAIWKFYFRFQFWTSYRHRHVTNFIRIAQSLTELWHYVDFPRWRPYGGTPKNLRFSPSSS